jgi:hypothetical protein
MKNFIFCTSKNYICPFNSASPPYVKLILLSGSTHVLNFRFVFTNDDSSKKISLPVHLIIPQSYYKKIAFE